MLDGKVDLPDRDLRSQHLRPERNSEVLVDHREQAGDLLLVVVAVDGGLLDQHVQLRSRHPPVRVGALADKPGGR